MGDSGSYVIILARYLAGEIEELLCTEKTFFEGPLPVVEDGLVVIPGKKQGKVDFDDVATFLSQFKNRKTIDYLEMTRYGTAHRNQNQIEIKGNKGDYL